jgi:hypothetical protein
MLSGSRRGPKITLAACLLLWAPSTFAQATSARAPDGVATPDVAAPHVARNLAFAYLDVWSAPNRVTLASVSSFYGSTVTFHGRTVPLGSMLAEKRRFAERWPNRAYRHRPETTQVSCEAGGARCTVWSIFDFSAGNSRQGRRSRGIGEHELVVSLSSGRPVIVSENSRVVLRGRGNMTEFLKEEL